MDELIKVNNLTLGYDNKIVLRDLSFCVYKGDYLCISGENGTGKSTLLKALVNLHKPFRGSIKYLDGLKGKNIGYLPQQKDTQKDFPASVKEIVLSGFCNKLGLRPFYNKSEKSRAAESMGMLGISELADLCYHDLSGGQQQRVLLARAVCAAERLIALDEPIAGLDQAAAKSMYKMLERLHKEESVTVITVSHDSASDEYCSHKLTISNNLCLYK